MKSIRTGHQGGARRGDEYAANLPVDPYRLKSKPVSKSVCTECRAVFQRGRWVWAARPANAAKRVCPACLRIREHAAAGELRLGGAFLAAHKEEVTRLLRNEERHEIGRHPLQRIMEIIADGDALVVRTTDVHIARRLGAAGRHAFQGTLEIDQPGGEYSVRLVWTR